MIPMTARMAEGETMAKQLLGKEVTEALNIKHDPRSINNIKQYSHKRALEALQEIIDNKTMRQ